MRESILDYLEQERVWKDGTGETCELTSLEDTHLANLKGWLLRNAPKIHRSMIGQMYHFAVTLNGEMAMDAMDSAIFQAEEENPYLWMEERPLFQAVNREIAKRQGYIVCRPIRTE